MLNVSVCWYFRLAVRSTPKQTGFIFYPNILIYSFVPLIKQLNMILAIKPNIMFTNFGRNVSCRPTSSGLFEILSSPGPTINFKLKTVLLSDKSGNSYSTSHSALGMSLSFCRSKPIVSQYLTVILLPLVQRFSIEYRIFSSLGLSSFEQRRCKTSKKSPKVS